MKRLLAFGSFAHDPQRVLAAIQRLAIVGIECGPNLGVRSIKLRTATFADAKGGILFHDPQFAFRHEYSLAPNACANETAPVPNSANPCLCGSAAVLSNKPFLLRMDHPCHKCGQSAEDGVPFCSHCGAPQIRVAVPEPPPVERADEVGHGLLAGALGAPSNANASAGALRLPVQWSRAMPPCALAALIAAVVMTTGLVALPVAVLGAGFLAVAFYLRRIPGTTVSAKEGARLGALSGLLCFGMWAILKTLVVALLHQGPEIRKEMLDAVEQTASRYSDPQFQASVEFMRSPAGLTVMMIGTLIFAFLACVILASIGGALAGAFFGRRGRS